jgi:hypothetical protein
LVFTAGAEEEHEAACLILGRCGDVEACECAFVVGCDDGGLTGGENAVGLRLGHCEEESGREAAGRELAGWGYLRDWRAFGSGV